MADDLEPATLCAQALGQIDERTRALTPPIHPSVAYVRGPDGDYPGGHSYTRDHNPTYEQPEALLTRLEGGAAAKLFASGMAAATTVFEALDAGSHVLAPAAMYWTIRGWMQHLQARGRITLSLYRNEDLDDVRAKLQPGKTKLVWVETPANPTCAITDLAGVAQLARDVGAIVVADSTVATPVLCRPIAHGADLVMHSATKQLAGHTDVLAGALVTAREDSWWDRVGHERGYRGAVLGPFESWLLLRGMRTLVLRVRQSAATAQHVAQTLAAHERVAQVYYAGLESHPGHDIARRQMQGGYGAVVSFRPHGGEPAARRVLRRLRLFHDATSLGGVESLVEHRARVEGAGTPVPPDLLRLSIGIEDPGDLVADLEQALAG